MRNKRIFITFFFLSLFCYPIDPIDYTSLPMSIDQQHKKSYLENKGALFLNRKYTEAATKKAHILKKVAQRYLPFKNANQNTIFSETYLNPDYVFDITSDSPFDNIRDSDESVGIENKYQTRVDFFSFAYLYVALIGFYIAIILQFNKKVNKIAKVLISSFIFIHSVFILHICFHLTNYKYQFPHSILMSTAFSFLYGPLLYFYFKRITEEYVFKLKDILHLVPTFILFIFLIPYYALPAEEKLALMIERTNLGTDSEILKFLTIVFFFKLASLVLYGFVIRKIYIRQKNKKSLKRPNRLWQRNIYGIHISYVLSYAIYGFLWILVVNVGALYHVQIILMALMVLYIGYCANIQPSVFNGQITFDKLLFKYEKSGLTSSLSEELKDNLINLFDNEKIFKENDLNLEKLADRLNTTRHNASQVINEHFKMNFHELVNKYRINEAKKIFSEDYQKNLNIIDVAYEVGYNNKVTFNKAFKKDTQITPSEYQKTILEAS